MSSRKGVEGTYGHSRGGKGVEKTVISRDESCDGGGGEKLAKAAGSIYRNAVANRAGESGASERALQER